MAEAMVFSRTVAVGLSQTALTSSKVIAIMFWMVSLISDRLYPWSIRVLTYLRGRPLGFIVSPLSGLVSVPPFLAGTCVATMYLRCFERRGRIRTAFLLAGCQLFNLMNFLRLFSCFQRYSLPLIHSSTHLVYFAKWQNSSC